jgi:hypothetical protein
MEVQIGCSDYVWSEERFIAFIRNWKFKSSPSTKTRGNVTK